MQKRFIDRFRPALLSASHAQIEQWLANPTGEYLLTKERELARQLPPPTGYHLMELGLSADRTLLDEFDNLHRFALSPVAGSGGQGAVVDFEALPLPSDIIETAILHHVLEFSPRPHAVLNEVARVIAPGGHLVLFVLNPFSLFGMLKWPASLIDRQQIWRHHSLRMGRLVDWLRLLHFRSIKVQRGGFGPVAKDLPDSSWWERWGYGFGLPGGLFYTIVARKHVARAIQSRNDLWKQLKVPNISWQQRATSHQPECLPEGPIATELTEKS